MIVNIRQAAKIKSVGRLTIYKWIKRGRITPVQQTGASVLLDTKDLDKIQVKHRLKTYKCPECQHTGHLKEFTK